MTIKQDSTHFQQKKILLKKRADLNYLKVARFSTSHSEAHAGFFRLLMKGISDPYVL